MPPPVAGEEDQDPRVIAARAAAKDYDKPEMHLFDPDGPEEDLVYFAGLNMRAYHGALPMPDEFLDWWMADDFASTYTCHARVLKLLQSRRPPYLWLLKAPVHVFKLEAFAAQYLSVEKDLGLDRERVNVNGGAIALGHPLGMTGTRLLLTLTIELRRRGLRRGLATACIGGGQGIAAIIETV